MWENESSIKSIYKNEDNEDKKDIKKKETRIVPKEII
jgi:hypothetical protein